MRRLTPEPPPLASFNPEEQRLRLTLPLQLPPVSSSNLSHRDGDDELNTEMGRSSFHSLFNLQTFLFPILSGGTTWHLVASLVWTMGDALSCESR